MNFIIKPYERRVNAALRKNCAQLYQYDTNFCRIIIMPSMSVCHIVSDMYLLIDFASVLVGILFKLLYDKLNTIWQLL